MVSGPSVGRLCALKGADIRSSAPAMMCRILIAAAKVQIKVESEAWRMEKFRPAVETFSSYKKATECGNISVPALRGSSSVGLT